MSTTIERPAMARLQVRERSNSPMRQRSQQSPRRVPSPLRHAEFRPLAMEYAVSPQPRSCKYYSPQEEEEELTPGGTPGGYCSTVRTVGYSTVGGKAFMSGKCPYCKRMVKSDTQVCTPNATPPPSPWKIKLQSPLQSPLRSPKTPGGQTSLRSPLRSPFKGNFFSASTDSNAPTADDDKKPQSPKPAAGASGSVSSSGSSRTPPRGRSPRTGRSPTRSPRARSPGPVSPSRAPDVSTRGPRSPGPRSPLRSPWKGASFFENGSDDEVPTKAMARSRGAHSPGPRSPLRVKVNYDTEMDELEEKERAEAAAAVTERSKQRGWRSPLRSPFKGGFFGGGNKSGVGAVGPVVGSE